MLLDIQNCELNKLSITPIQGPFVTATENRPAHGCLQRTTSLFALLKRKGLRMFKDHLCQSTVVATETYVIQTLTETNPLLI